MRLLEYRQELFGQGYTVSASDNHYDSGHTGKCPPIRMARLIRNQPVNVFDDLIENIRFNWDSQKGTEDEHRRKYADILCGRNPQWQIVAFQVLVGRIALDIYNQETKESSFFSLVGGIYECEVQFDVPHADGRPCSLYRVSIQNPESCNTHPSTTVTEYLNHARREISFFHKAPDSEEEYIEVTEYADL